MIHFIIQGERDQNVTSCASPDLLRIDREKKKVGKNLSKTAYRFIVYSQVYC